VKAICPPQSTVETKNKRIIKKGERKDSLWKRNSPSSRGERWKPPEKEKKGSLSQGLQIELEERITGGKKGGVPQGGGGGKKTPPWRGRGWPGGVNGEGK